MTRTSLSAKQWARLRAYVSSLDAKATEELRHRCATWEKSVAQELGRVADGKPPTDRLAKSNSLDASLIEQVAGWLKKR
jgi:hypothetical protein